MNTHLVAALIIAAILVILGAFVVLAGILKSAGKADAELEHIEPGDLMDRPKPSHEVGRQIVASIRRKQNERN